MFNLNLCQWRKDYYDVRIYRQSGAEDVKIMSTLLKEKKGAWEICF